MTYFRVAAMAVALSASLVASAADIKTTVVNAEDLHHYNKVLMVPTVYVNLLVKGGVFAAKQTSGLASLGGGSGGTAKASAKFTTTGIDAELATTIARQAYDDFVKQLRDAGYTVLTYDDIKDRPEIKAMERQAMPAGGGLPIDSQNGNDYIVAAPSAEQYFKKGLANGIFNQFSGGRGSKVTDATVLIAEYTVTAPQVWAETGSGYKSVKAGVNGKPGMTISSARVSWLGKPVVRMMRGIPGVQMNGQMVDVSTNVGTLNSEDKTPTAGNVVSGVLGRLTGTSTINATSRDYELVIDRDAYTTGATAGISAFNAEVAKAAREAKPK
jgi:hypothetical protein